MGLSRAQHQRIQRIAKGRSEEALYLLEGRRAVQDALPLGVVAELWVRRDLDEAWRQPLEEAAFDAHVHVQEAGAADFDRMGKTVSPQGVFALVRDTRCSLDEVVAGPGWMLWLDGVQDPGNMGAVVRVAVGFGAGGLLVSEGGAHPLGFKALRASSGVALQVPFAREPAARIAARLAEETRPIWILERGGQDVFAFPETPDDFVLVIGSEGRGAGEEARAAADGLLGIPIDPRVESLNAAVAAGIAVAQLTQGRVPAVADPGTILPATVMRLDARGCLVFLDEPIEGLPGGGRELWCGVRGRIHLRDRPKQKSPVAVGDRVYVVHTGEDRGAVESLEARSSSLSRPSIRRGRIEHVMAANVDRVVIVTALNDPPFNPSLVDRLLAVIAFSNLEAVLVINKMDLGEAEPPEAAVYRALGVPVVLTSATTGLGIEEMADELAGRTSVVTGHSGVGKSSLLNAIQPRLGLDIGDVNVVTGRGTHTTTAAVWIPLERGGAVIDTAGVREFGLFGIPKRDLPWLFKDIAAIAQDCRYPDCSHTHEPGCAVQEALLDGELAPFRFDSYLKILESLDEKHD